MNTHELAWAAGFYDGEGCTSSRTKRPRAVLLQVTQKDPQLLDRFRLAVGVGRVYPKSDYAFQWAVSAKADVHLVCWLLWPWLGAPKRAQFERVFRLYHDHFGD